MTVIAYYVRLRAVYDDTCAWTRRRDPIQTGKDSSPSKWVDTDRNELRSGKLALPFDYR